MLVGGSRYPVKLVEVRASWSGHHGYPTTKKKRQPGALKLPLCAGPGRAEPQWLIACSLTLQLCKSLFPWLESMTSWSHGKSLTSNAKAPLPTTTNKKKKNWRKRGWGRRTELIWLDFSTFSWFKSFLNTTDTYAFVFRKLAETTVGKLDLSNNSSKRLAATLESKDYWSIFLVDWQLLVSQTCSSFSLFLASKVLHAAKFRRH